MKESESHNCPARKCEIRVPYKILACPTHWAVLSKATKAAIFETKDMLIIAPKRHAALRAAMDEWKAAGL